MKTLLLSLLCLFVWTRHTEAVSDLQVTLGQNVTVACEFETKTVHWFVIKPPARPLMIMETYGYDRVDYYNETLRKKYSEDIRSRLKIININADDLGIYYCIRPGSSLEVSDGIRLHSAGHILYPTRAPEDHSKPAQTDVPQNQTTYQILTAIFALSTVVLFATVIGLLKMNHKLSKIPRLPKYENANQILDMRARVCEKRPKSVSTGYDRPESVRTDRLYLEVQP